MENTVDISGIISLDPQIEVSASGITHRQWIMQHQSEKFSAGLRRKVWLRVIVYVTGNDLVQASETFTVGMKINAKGFLSARKNKRGDTQLVLYAQDISVVVDEEQE